MYLFEFIDGDDVAFGCYKHEGAVIVEMSDPDNFLDMYLWEGEIRSLRDALTKVLDDKE